MEFEELRPFVVAMMRHKGRHHPDDTASTWEDLILWASPRRLLGRSLEVRGIGLLWDDPRQFPPELRRYDVGVPIDPHDSSDVDEPAFVALTMPGDYLKATHEGAYDAIMQTYDRVLEVTMKVHGLELVSAPIIEVYRNSPAEVAERDLRTDLYFPCIRM